MPDDEIDFTPSPQHPKRARAGRRALVYAAKIAALAGLGAIAFGAAWLFFNRDDIYVSVSDLEVGWSPTRPGEMVVQGTFTLLDTARRSIVTDRDACHGTGGYADITAAAQVKLTADGKTLDVTHLSEGRAHGFTECEFSFSLKVPRGHKFYEVEVGRRGTLSYSYEKITTPGAIALSLGTR